MATQNTKKIGQRPVAKPDSRIDTLHNTWTVMKPFVHFSVKAMQVIGHGLLFIVKNVPRPGEHKDKGGDGRVVKL